MGDPGRPTGPPGPRPRPGCSRSAGPSQILEILAQRGGAGVSEIAEDLGVHKSTAFRLLGALEEHGLVGQAAHRGKYQLGFGILRLASAVPGRLDLVREGRPICQELAASLAETVNLAVLRSHYAVNLDQVRGPAAVSAHNWVGQLTPLHATSSGKILLAHLQPPSSAASCSTRPGWNAFTPHTVTSRDGAGRPAHRGQADGWAAHRRGVSRSASTRWPRRSATTPEPSSGR